MRERVGDFVVGVRYLGDEVIEGGSDLADAVWFGVELARAGVDYLSVGALTHSVTALDISMRIVVA